MSNSLTLTRRNCGQYIEKNMELPQNCRSISAETFFNRPDIRSVVFPYEMEQIGNIPERLCFQSVPFHREIPQNEYQVC